MVRIRQKDLRLHFFQGDIVLHGQVKRISGGVHHDGKSAGKYDGLNTSKIPPVIGNINREKQKLL